MKCLTCSKEFEADRVTAKYCSDKCKQVSYRNKDTVTTLEGGDVTLKSVTVKAGLCHGCNESQENLNVCICHICIAKGITHKSLGVKMCSDTSNYE